MEENKNSIYTITKPYPMQKGDTVAIDLDGVVFTLSSLLEVLTREFRGFTPSMLKEYNIQNSLYNAGLLKEKSDTFEANFYGKFGAEIFGKAEMYEDIPNLVSFFKCHGINVCFLTARIDTEQNREILKAVFNYYDLPLDNTVLIGNSSKALYCVNNNIRMIIEDKPETLINASNMQGIDYVLGRKHLYNQHVQYEVDGVVLYENFDDMMVKELTKEGWFVSQ